MYDCPFCLEEGFLDGLELYTHLFAEHLEEALEADKILLEDEAEAV